MTTFRRLALLLVLVAVPAVQAADWANWRGPHYNGSTDEKGLPSNWSTTENIAWTADLPGSSAATPIVCENRVFISGIDDERETLQAMCFDRTNGNLVWAHDIAQGIRRDRRSTYAAASPVTDGKIVVFFYANGDLLCFDVDGKRLWARNLHEDYGTFAFLWTPASSPALLGGRIYVQVLQRDVPVSGRGLTDRENESYILAVEPQNGKTIWRHIRPSRAVAESREAFSTPIPFSLNGAGQLLVVGGDALTSHNLDTGEELWRWGTYNPRRIGHWRLVPSPVSGGGVVLVCAPKNDPVYAIRPGVAGDQQAVAWDSSSQREVSSDVPTPAFYDGDFFILSDLRKSLARVEPATGKIKWSISTPGRTKYEASPLAADDRIYIINHAGEAAVINAVDGNVLKVIPMDERAGQDVVRASIAAANGRLFIRTTRKLYCVGATP